MDAFLAAMRSFKLSTATGEGTDADAGVCAEGAAAVEGAALGDGAGAPLDFDANRSLRTDAGESAGAA